MKTKKSGNSVLRELRKIRNKHAEETKHMSIAERVEYDCKKTEIFKEKFAAVEPDYECFSYILSKEIDHEKKE
ncbi:MAG: hypothetical protein LBC02_02640 [Planctomycetaceae bacterium]|jgi:hypothetical protein|nr:hypothetical protein [Planctomycetaceae bacterium]